MPTGLTDARGDMATGANQKSLAHYEQALGQFQRYVDDPVGAIDLAIEESPAFVMAHCLRAYLLLSGAELAAIATAAASLGTAASLSANDRERLHVAAITELVAGEYERAEERLEDILIAHPRDILALQVAHLFDFYRGDARSLRDRVARVLPCWSDSVPGYHAVLGMYAFGLEECANYAKAEETGRKAVAHEPRDTWAHHAVTHVMEMQGRREEGVQWMRSREAAWAKDSFLAVHNWWHLALFLLDLDRTDEVLRLYDGPIRKARSRVMLDMIDASALLWRLKLRGVDVGRRWDELSEAWAPLAADGFYAFNDTHAMMAFVAAERWDLCQAVIAAQEARLGKTGSNQAMTRDVGLPVCRALHAFGRGDYRTTVDCLRPLRGIASRFGGSHAQRDVLDLTLLEAAARDRQLGLVRALAGERMELKPPAPLTLRYQAAAEAGAGQSVADAGHRPRRQHV